MNFSVAFQTLENNKIRWIECYDFIENKIYYLSLNSDGKIKLKDSIIKNVDITKYMKNGDNGDSQSFEINKKQMEDLMNLDNYSLMKMDKFEFAKKYNLEQAFI
jgi:hypothetical protein